MNFIRKGPNIWILLQKEQSNSSEEITNWKGNNRSPIIIIANEEIKKGIQEDALKLAFTAKETFGVKDIILTPDVHMGNFIPTGCVLTSIKHIYPGSIGDDIGCGMRLIKTNITKDRITPNLLTEIINEIDLLIPTGFNHNASPPIERDILKRILIGKHQTDDNAYREHPPYKCEDKFLDDNYLKQAEETIGTLGGGNHFIEFQIVSKVMNEEIASMWGLYKDQLVIMIHSGSRSFGAKIAHENIGQILNFFNDWGLETENKNGIYCPENSDLGKQYLNGMRMALNFAIENRSLMEKRTIKALKKIIPEIECELLYDICHNTITNEKLRNDHFWIHRKGATRAFPGKHHFLEDSIWKDTGHPVLLPGSMGTESYIMRGLDGSNSKSAYYSINHGAGRKMGRKQAHRELSDEEAIESLGDVITNQPDINSIKDEVSLVYKDISEIIESVEGSGIAESIVSLQPIGVLKGANG